MDRLIYTAMTGANASASRQAVLSNNLANVSTNGFRAQLATYRAVPVLGDGATTRVFALEATSGFSDKTGPGIITGNNLDVMTAGNSWFAVTGTDGTEAYTRNGHMEVGPDGTLTTSGGLPMLSSGGTNLTVPQGATVSIGDDGTVMAQIGNQPANSLGRLKMATATEDDPLKRSEDGLFRTTSGDPMNNDDTARLHVGALEGSNVNAIESMVGMIQTARQFEAQTKLMSTAEANDRSAAQLLCMQG